MSDHKFPKSLRLTNKKKFDQLFEEGQIIKAFPLKLVFIVAEKTEDSEPFQLAFTAPKRSFKKAVDRNFLKRRMKEAFRLHKNDLLSNASLADKSFYGILIYTNREKMDFHAIEKGYIKLIGKLSEKLNII